MTLRQEVEQLIGQWQGCDAMDRSAQREQLVDDLLALMSRRLVRAEPNPQAAPAVEQARPAA